ncbi:hypothetical protein PoB_005570900 [Plakobranchus ocellatus]|uniref:Uncharacterized protein n=1 Tax=Plakobranchus ocellatus TaxID=259542 RepID=A0AAV4CEN8_9GAST|nr:hypothetical protein PoB_005570900 [Plakobranchus ocellatus]
MYNMYVDNHARAGCNSPASKTTYRDVFNKEFNIGFYKCAKDRCDVCAAQENIQVVRDEYKVHIELKEASRFFEADILKKDNIYVSNGSSRLRPRGNSSLSFK